MSAATVIAIDTLRLLLFPALMAFAASTDLFTMTISNKVSVALVIGFFVLAAVMGMSAADMLSHAAAAAAVLVVTFAFFARGWIGGGDAKLAAATALWFGFDHLLDYALIASLFGGALTLLMIRFRLVPLPERLARQEWITRLHKLDGGVPYGIALAAAALVIYPDTEWMRAFGA
jgi:prepilin peptidase CpaA